MEQELGARKRKSVKASRKTPSRAEKEKAMLVLDMC